MSVQYKSTDFLECVFLLGTKGIVQGNQLVNNSRRRRKVDGLNVANEFAPFGAGRGTQGKRIPAPTGTVFLSEAREDIQFELPAAGGNFFVFAGAIGCRN